MKKLIGHIEDRLFQTADSICLDRARLVTEAYARHDGLPVPILRARVFEHVIKATIINTNIFMENRVCRLKM